MKSFLLTVVVLLSVAFYQNTEAQSFPTPASLSTGQGAQGSFDPVWLVSGWYSSSPPNPMGLSYTPALISNNCAPSAWVNPLSLPFPVNNGNWITNPSYPCSSNTNDGYIYFRLTLNLPAACNGVSIAAAGNYTLYLIGYVDNSISDVYVNGTSTGISGGGYSGGSQLNMTLTGPWVAGANYVDVLVYNTPNGGQANPYGLLLVANTTVGYANGCPPAIAGDTIICRGDSTTLWVNESGYNYSWSNGSVNDSIKVCPNANTSYSVTVTNSGGYRDSSTVTVIVHPLPVAAITPAAPGICQGNSASLTASGGTSYAWSNAANTPTITVSPASTTTYSVTVTNANSCSASASRTVTVHPPPTAVINPANPTICLGNSTTLTASGGTSYLWSNAANTAVITVSPAATTSYSVTVTDANSCTATTSKTVTVNPLPTAVINPANPAICLGNSTTLTASGGTSYAWSNTANTSSITVSPTTTTPYSVTVTDINSCTATTSKTVTVNPLPTPVINPVTPAICLGNSTTLTASGGNSYAWSNAANTSSIRVSPTITTPYSVTVTDINSCTATTSKTVTVNPLPTAVINPVNPAICLGNSTTLTASGGNSYAWSNAANTSSIPVSPTITTPYSVTVTDINSCTASTTNTVTVNQLPIPVINPVNPAICLGNSTTLTANGGTSYAWSNAANTSSITVSPTATTPYSVTVTDINSCTAATTNTVRVNPLPIPAINPTNPAVCLGNSTTLTATGGASYVWSNAATTASISVSPVTTTPYSVTVTDINSCTATISNTVTVNPLPTAIINPVNPAICPGNSTTLIASGGTNYLWSNAAITAAITVSPSATTLYAVTVTDINSCIATTSTSVTVNPLPTALISPAVVQICLGTDTTLTATGGVTYAWSTSASTQNIAVSPIVTTSYSVTVTDANTCTNSTSRTVAVDPTMILSVSTTNVSCNGGSDGTIDLTVNSGQSPYQYLWNNTATTQNINGLTIGSYYATVTDNGGCTATTSASLTEPPLLAITSSSIDPTCKTIASNGSITLNATGGVSPYQYLWSDNTASAYLSNEGPGNYSVTVSDANNCTLGAAFSLTYMYDFSVQATPSVTIKLGDSTILGYTVSGNSGAVTSLWNPAASLNCSDCIAPVAQPDLTTLYQIEIRNDSGCTAIDTVTVYVIPDHLIYIPNAFTPNGDGVNDQFRIYSNPKAIAFLEIQIFNRWGEVVYKSNDLDFNWDGTYKGTMQEPGLFVWQLNVTFIDGHTDQTQKGSLTMIR